MFAVVESGGKQYRVAKNDKIIVENLNSEVGKNINLDVIFLQKENGEIAFGDPKIEGVKVEAEVIKNFKDKKIIIFKKRRRQNSRRKNGHRQQRTQIKIIDIKL